MAKVGRKPNPFFDEVAQRTGISREQAQRSFRSLAFREQYAAMSEDGRSLLMHLANKQRKKKGTT